MTTRSQHRKSPMATALQGLVGSVGPLLIYVVMRLLDFSLRVEFDGLEVLLERWRRGERVILTFWHGRQAAMAFAARILDQPFCILVSQHRDGEIATRVLRRWGVGAVRGSATRGGAAGFLNMVRVYRAGTNLAMVPDGPKGPNRVAKPGVLRLARATGAELVPVSFAADRTWRLDSWDAAVIPKPFARIVITIGVPLRIAKDAGQVELDRALVGLGHDLDELTERAEKSVAPA